MYTLKRMTFDVYPQLSTTCICTCINTSNRKRRSGKRDFAVSANMAYHGRVNLYYLRDASGASGESEEYEDPDRTVRCGHVLRDDGVYEPIEIPAPQGPIS